MCGGDQSEAHWALIHVDAPHPHYKDAISSQSLQINGRASLPLLLLLRCGAAPPAGWMDEAHAAATRPLPRLFMTHVSRKNTHATNSQHKDNPSGLLQRLGDETFTHS